MEKCGVDTSDIYIAQPFTGEACFDVMKDFMGSKEIDLVVLDSLAGLVPTAVMEAEESFNYSPMASQARFINQSIPRILPFLKGGAAVLLINQTRDTIGAARALSNIPGGQGQVFFSHLILKVRRDGWITEGNNKVGFDIEIRNEKTKSGGYSQRACIVPFKFDGGIDIVESEIRELIAHDIIVRAGAWYQLPSGEKVMGMGGLKTFFSNNHELLYSWASSVPEEMEEYDEEEEDETTWVLPEDEEMLKDEFDAESTV